MAKFDTENEKGHQNITILWYDKNVMPVTIRINVFYPVAAHFNPFLHGSQEPFANFDWNKLRKPSILLPQIVFSPPSGVHSACIWPGLLTQQDSSLQSPFFLQNVPKIF